MLAGILKMDLSRLALLGLVKLMIMLMFLFMMMRSVLVLLIVKLISSNWPGFAVDEGG